MENSKIEWTHHKDIRIYPELMAEISKHGLSPVGRVWLILRHYPTDGPGWVKLSTAVSLLCDDLGLYDHAQLEQIIRQGEGVFWSKDIKNDRVFMSSPARVAGNMGLEATGFKVQTFSVPAKDLTGDIQRYNAAVGGAYTHGVVEEVSK